MCEGETEWEIENTEDKIKVIFMHVCVCVCTFLCLYVPLFEWQSKSRVPCDWFSLCFPHSHHQRKTWCSWIQLRRLSPATTVIKQTGEEEMRTSTAAAASALSSIALFPFCQFSVYVRDVCTKRRWMTSVTYQAWVIFSISSVQFIQESRVESQMVHVICSFLNSV